MHPHIVPARAMQRTIDDTARRVCINTQIGTEVDSMTDLSDSELLTGIRLCVRALDMPQRSTLIMLIAYAQTLVERIDRLDADRAIA